MSAVVGHRRADHGGAGLVPRRRASARVAQHDDVVLFVVVDVFGVFGDARAVAEPNPPALMSAVVGHRRADHGGAGPVPRRRASARGAQNDDLFLFVVVDVSAAFGDAGAVARGLLVARNLTRRR